MMHRRIVIICIALLLSATGRASAATPEQVEEAIKKAISYIYSQQQGGNWEVTPARTKEDAASVEGMQWGGLSSLATCALLYARESPQDPRIKEAIDWLLKAEIQGIYALGFRCQVWQMTPNVPGVKEKAHVDLKLLLDSVHKRGTSDGGTPLKGMYPYAFYKGKPLGERWYDHSVSQYGVLAMWALNQMNIEVPTDYWRVTETAWREHQNDDGGWSYQFRERDPTSTVAMTAAGLATLFITQDYVHSMEGLNCTGNVKDKHLERALRWISVNFKKVEGNHYALYGIERVGVASGYKYFGEHDWYKYGADFLVRTQKEDGSWGDEQPRDNAKKIPSTGFGLMFLVRGRAPVLMNKLDYAIDTAGDKPKPPTWNQRPREVANITRWISKQIEKDLNWQIVNFDAAKAEDLHDAPILWISGRDALVFTSEQEAKLKAFVEGGGLILGHSDCASKTFTDSFKKLGSKIFPYEFKELHESHPIYTAQQYQKRAARPPSVLGLSNGARELMLLIPMADPGKGWQTQTFQGAEREPLAQLMANIFLYSVDKKNLRNKGETYIVNATPGAAEKTVKVARLEYAGNWNPEPGGWKRLHALMHNSAGTDLAVESNKLGTGKLAGFPIAHMTGTTKFSLSAKEEAELKKFVEDGGTLVVDAAGGAGEFALAAEAAMTKMIGAKAFTVLKGDSEVFTNAGPDAGQVEYRQFAKKVLGNIKTPRLRMATLGKGKVYLSQEDLSVGLVGQPVDGIYGYEPKTATAIMSNIILSAGK